MFKGSIDEFKIYSRALSAEEIIAEKNQFTQKKDNNSFSNENIKNTIIYPNPVTNNRFTITTKTELIGKEVQIKLIDLTGRTVYLKSVTNDTGTIDVVLNQTLSGSIYVLSLNDQYIGKIVIK
jgi:transcription elongation factor